MANATSNSTSVVLTENDIPGAAQKDANLQHLKEETCPASTWSFLGAIMNTVYCLTTSPIINGGFLSSSF